MQTTLINPARLYGLIAEFETPESLLAATEAAYAQGYRKMDAYSPYPVDGLAEALGMHHTRLSMVVLLGGILGAVGGFGLQFYAMVIGYPLNVGGRPLNSWPAFIPIAFETTILVAAFFAVLGMFALNGLPEPYHPVFNLPSFEQASRHRFFLAIEAKDTHFDLEKTDSFLRSLNPLAVTAVEN